MNMIKLRLSFIDAKFITSIAMALKTNETRNFRGKIFFSFFFINYIFLEKCKKKIKKRLMAIRTPCPIILDKKENNYIFER